MVKYLRKWSYTSCFGGECQTHFPPEMSEVEVRAELKKSGKISQNWQYVSLKRGKLVKEGNAHRR